MKDKIGRFEDFDVWKLSMRLSVEIYKSLKNCRDYGLKDQMQRAAVSIPSNIAEGFERQSNKEFIRYLYIARGSCGELRTQLYLAFELDLLNREKIDNLIKETRKISAMLSNLIKTREEKFV